MNRNQRNRDSLEYDVVLSSSESETSSSSSSSSSSSNDEKEFEIDGFPPALVATNRLTSVKSNFDSTQFSPRTFLPMNSRYTIDTALEELLRKCIKIIKDPISSSEEEKNKLIEKLESEIETNCAIAQEGLMDSFPQFTSLLSPINNSPLTHLHQHQQHETRLSFNSIDDKPSIKNIQPTLRVSVDIPSVTDNPNTVKYSTIHPTYDRQNKCWHMGIDFLLGSAPSALIKDVITESSSEQPVEDKSIQVEINEPDELNRQQSQVLDSKDIENSFLLLSKPLVIDKRVKGEEKIIFPNIINTNFLATQSSTDVDISYLEKFEGEFEDTRNSISSFRASFCYYKNVILSTLEKLLKQVAILKKESDSLFQTNYDIFSESQFKRHSQNQLLLVDLEQQICFVKSEVSKKDIILEKITKTTNLDQNDQEIFKQTQIDLRKARFAYSIRVIYQMMKILKEEIQKLISEIHDQLKQ